MSKCDTGQIDALPATCRPVVLHILENGSTDESPKLAQQSKMKMNTHLLFGHTSIFLPAKPKPGTISCRKRPPLDWSSWMRTSGWGPKTLLNLLNRLEQSEGLNLVGAVAQLPPRFTPANFWQSVFAVPYSALPPANSLAGGAYVAKRESLSAMPEDVINEDLYLSLQHEGAFAWAADAPLFVTPPETLEIFKPTRPHHSFRSHRTESKPTFERQAPPTQRASNPFSFLAKSRFAQNLGFSLGTPARSKPSETTLGQTPIGL